MEQRLIDANALKAKKTYSHERHEYIVPVAEIDWMPTVDAVPVVRCKDCIEYRDCVGACHYFNYEPTDEMDFCSHGIRADGERKDDGN